MGRLLVLFGAQYLLFVILGIALLWFLMQPRVRRKEVAVMGILMSIIAFVLARVGAALYADPRPFVTGHVVPLFPHVPDNGFPSDHVLLGAVVAMTVFRYDRRLGLLLILLTATVGLSRVMAHVHHVIDIIGSIGVALLSSWIVFTLLRPIVASLIRVE